MVKELSNITELMFVIIYGHIHVHVPVEIKAANSIQETCPGVESSAMSM